MSHAKIVKGQQTTAQQSKVIRKVKSNTHTISQCHLIVFRINKSLDITPSVRNKKASQLCRI
jgi:hypothetical protein